MKNDWQLGIHHDGSERYVSNPLPTLGEIVTITLRTPKNAPIRMIALRMTIDGEQHFEPMKKVEEDTLSDYWQAQMIVHMPLMNYRFHIRTETGTLYFNGVGVHQSEPLDLFDFKLLADYEAPSWLPDAVFYQIFPDRFRNGDPSNDVTEGEWDYKGVPVHRREWGELPGAWRETRSLDFFGGDLIGIEEKLSYLRDLGINAIYLNPIFVSQSNHRYNMDDFYTVDPHVGGNEALASLTDAMHAQDMRLILDMTPNHSSDTHQWFVAAQQDENAPTAEYYTFKEHPDDYESWLGVPTLPKLNYTSQKLRNVMYRDDDAVLRFWLKPPFNIDGWRLDVYNMTARQGKHQYNHEVGRGIRRAVKETSPDSYLFGEHFFDGTLNLQGDEMDGMMNYRGFNIPLWRWLSGYDGLHGLPDFSDTTLMDSTDFVEQVTQYRASIPWIITRQQFHQLGSHDTDRILNIVGLDKSLMRLGVVMLMAYPGVPCIYYGDEIGLEGERDPDNRRCMPWDEAAWDIDLRHFHKQVIHLRRTLHALMHGGFQQVHAEGGLWAFLRESQKQRLLVVGYRGPEPAMNVRIPVAHAGIADGVRLNDHLSDQAITVSEGHITIPQLQKGDALILEG